VLAKVQRAMDAPVTLERQAKREADPATLVEPAARKKTGKTDGTAAGASAAPAAGLDLSRYVFWREEDNVLFDFRDKRVATFAYRCRPQYDLQPESDIPLSLLFVLQYGALRQAIEEMKKREATQPEITRY